MRRRHDEHAARLDRVEATLGSVQVALERIELMFLMKDPSVAAGADAYEGLRRSLILAREDRMARLVDLARIDASLQRSDGEGDPAGILDELLSSTGVRRIDGPVDHDRFDIFGESGAGTELVLLEPAYVHAESGAVIRSGRARYEFVADPEPDGPSADDVDTADDVADQDGAEVDEVPVGDAVADGDVSDDATVDDGATDDADAAAEGDADRSHDREELS